MTLKLTAKQREERRKAETREFDKQRFLYLTFFNSDAISIERYLLKDKSEEEQKKAIEQFEIKHGSAWKAKGYIYTVEPSTD